MKNLKIPQLRLHLLPWVLMCTAATACWFDSMAQAKTENTDSKLVNKSDSLQEKEKAPDTALPSNLVYGVNVAFGTRLSFIEAKASNDLYYDISCFIPKFGTVFGKSLFGVDFGMTERGPQKLFDTEDEKLANASHNIILDQVEIQNSVGRDSVSVLYRSFSRTRLLEKESAVVVYAAPTIRISDKVFGLIHFQHDFRKRIYSLADESIQTETDTISYNDYISSVTGLNNNIPADISSFGSKQSEIHTMAASFGGIGGIFLIDYHNVNIRIKPVVGIEYTRYTRSGDRTVNDFDFYSAHFLLDFRIIENKKIGFKVGGSLSGDVNFGETLRDTQISTDQPFIYLAKVWDIDKLMDFLKAGS